MGKILEAFGLFFILLIIYFLLWVLVHYVKKLLSKQTKIKCLCKHEYESYSAFYFGGIEYEFKCRKCGKILSVKTVTDDKFDWINKENSEGHESEDPDWEFK